MTKKYIVSLALLIAHTGLSQCANKEMGPVQINNRTFKTIKNAFTRNPQKALKKYQKILAHVDPYSQAELRFLAEDLQAHNPPLAQAEREALTEMATLCTRANKAQEESKKPVPKPVSQQVRPVVAPQPVKPQSPLVHPASPMGKRRQLFFNGHEWAKQVRVIGQLARISKVTREFEKFEHDNY